MHETRQSAASPLESAERRAHARLDVTSATYVDLGNVNGGIVFNISEDGFAMTTAMVLASDDLLTMRIQFPDSGDWIEASGQIAWIGKSKKEAGVRFVGLKEDARLRIREWISSKSSASELRENRDVPPEERSLDTVTIDPSKSSIPESVKPHTFAEKQMQDAVLPADLATPLMQGTGGHRVPPAEQAQVISDSLRGENAFRSPDRRLHPRRRVIPFTFFESGENNGGIVVNLSEGGLALTAAALLTDDQLSRIRIQFPESSDCIEARGHLAWISESKKEGGIEFVDLPQDVVVRIREWVSLEASSAEIQEEMDIARARENRDRPLEMPNTPLPDSLFSGPPESQEVAQEQSEVEVSSPNASLIPCAAKLSAAVSMKREFQAKLKSGAGQRSLGMRWSWTLAAALVGLVAVISFTIGWISARHGARNEAIGMTGQKTRGPSEPAKGIELAQGSAITNNASPQVGNAVPQAQGIEPTPADTRATAFVPPLENSRPPGPVIRSQRPLVSTIVNGPSRPVRNTLSQGQSVKLTPPTVASASNPAMENAPPQATGSFPVQDKETVMALSTSPDPDRTERAPIVDPREKESSPPLLEQPDVPVSATGLVAIISDPYPSIRIPPELSLRKLPQGGALQIGRLISRVEPVYPEDAKRQSVEGAVKLHVVVGRDGSIESLESVSGPSLLVKAALSAVREWHYAQTLLAGQPVETEQDIMIKFRLLNPSSSKN
jgi:TonB family protein